MGSVAAGRRPRIIGRVVLFAERVEQLGETAALVENQFMLRFAGA
ncbi:MAG: hypothetical protein ACK58T_01420 [Phycisphaerae bacterium]|jgi:hypothetical protein